MTDIRNDTWFGSKNRGNTILVLHIVSVLWLFVAFPGLLAPIRCIVIGSGSSSDFSISAYSIVYLVLGVFAICGLIGLRRWGFLLATAFYGVSIIWVFREAVSGQWWNAQALMALMFFLLASFAAPLWIVVSGLQGLRR
ncbi:MAG: hypothetical protein JW955_05135 [Sedimentisphaerales bacterium]|nr:hypothetical protein [Sedimentisphaerales bacterium]